MIQEQIHSYILNIIEEEPGSTFEEIVYDLETQFQINTEKNIIDENIKLLLMLRKIRNVGESFFLRHQEEYMIN
jgi:hypothetical protein